MSPSVSTGQGQERGCRRELGFEHGHEKVIIQKKKKKTKKQTYCGSEEPECCLTVTVSVYEAIDGSKINLRDVLIEKYRFELFQLCIFYRFVRLIGIQ
jgi:hypothetical protein